VSEVGQPAARRLAAGYVLGAVGVLALFVLWTRGLLRPLLPVLVIVGIGLVVRQVWKAIAAPPP
jgi:hypothetical protein